MFEPVHIIFTMWGESCALNSCFKKYVVLFHPGKEIVQTNEKINAPMIATPIPVKLGRCVKHK